MSMFSKIAHGIQGILLMMKYSTTFDTNVLKGKRIAIVGPANSAYGTGRGEYIDGFDYVIRINKAAMLVSSGKASADIGKKTDILCHSFFENEYSGGGPLDFKLYDQLGIRYVINPIPTNFGRRGTFNFYKKYRLAQKVYSLATEPYRKVEAAFGRFRPTTGFCALKLAIEADFAELFITGFTFFRTPYGDGYRDALKDMEANRKHIEKENHHSPEIEYQEFKKMLTENARKNICTDDTLQHMLKVDGIAIKKVS